MVDLISLTVIETHPGNGGNRASANISMPQPMQNVAGPDHTALRANGLEVYRLKDDLRAVKFDGDGHGQFMILSPGCIVDVQQTATLHGFIEVVCNGELLSVFYEDLELKGERMPGRLDR